MSFFDLRLPLGWLFVILGALLVVSGFWPPITSEGHLLGININAVWGAVMIGFGLVCLLFARNNARKREREETKQP